MSTADQKAHDRIIEYDPELQYKPTQDLPQINSRPLPLGGIPVADIWTQIESNITEVIKAPSEPKLGDSSTYKEQFQ